MQNDEIKELITTFKEYRDLITPIEQNLREFSVSFESIKNDIQNLNSSFDGNIQTKLDQIYKELSTQAEKSRTLASEVDRFMNSTNKYVNGVERMVTLCSGIEERIATLDNIQQQAEQQIVKLNSVIEEKRKNYDVKQLQRNLEAYSVSVEKVSEYLDKDVAENLKISNQKINQIQDQSTNIFDAIISEKASIEKLIEAYSTSNALLQKVVENNDVNQAYIFEILDKWAQDRKVKIKK